MPILPVDKKIDAEKSRVRYGGGDDQVIVALKLVFTDGTELIIKPEDLPGPNKKFDDDIGAEEKYNNLLNEWEIWSGTPDGIKTLIVEQFTWTDSNGNEHPFNMSLIQQAIHKEKVGGTIDQDERTMLNQYEKKALLIQDAIKKRQDEFEPINRVMMKITEIRKTIGEIFQYSSDEQERMFSATWLSGNGSTILTGIPGTGKSAYIDTAKLLLCNGFSDTELEQARRQYERFGQLETYSEANLKNLRDHRIKARKRKDTREVNRLTGEIRATESRADKLTTRKKLFMEECERKMLRHTATVRLDPEKSPEEVFYWTEVGLEKVTPGKQAYSFKPMPRDIVLKPVKFFNESSRMNIATQDAILGLMAEHEIEYLGQIFKSPNTDPRFVNDKEEDSWLWTEDLEGESPATKVPFDANIVVFCPKHPVPGSDGKDLNTLEPEERNMLLNIKSNLRRPQGLPSMLFEAGEWVCTEDPTHRSRVPTTRQTEIPLDYVIRPDPDSPWLTVYSRDKGQIIWFDTNPHVPSKLDLATADRLDLSIIMPALKLGGKAHLMNLKFKKGERPVGESLTEIAIRRILTWPETVSGEAINGIDPLNYKELQTAWVAVRKQIDATEIIPAITLLSELFSAKGSRYWASHNQGIPNPYPGESSDEITAGAEMPVEIYTPVVREGTANIKGVESDRENWGALVDMSTFEDPADRSKAVIPPGSASEMSGVSLKRWPAWEITRSFGTRAAESITKVAKALAFLEACDLAKPGDIWTGDTVKEKHILMTLPYVFSHRIWTVSEGQRGIVAQGKMAQMYPNVEMFIKKEIIEHFLKPPIAEGTTRLSTIDQWVDMFESAKEWAGETDETGLIWKRPPNRDMLENNSPQKNDDTLLNPIKNAIYDYAIFEYKKNTEIMVRTFKKQITELASRENFTLQDVEELETRIEAANLTTSDIDRETGGDMNTLMTTITNDLRDPYLNFTASALVSRRIIGFLIYVKGLPGINATQLAQINNWIESKGLDISTTDVINYSYGTDEFKIEIETSNVKSPRTNEYYVSSLRIELDSPDKSTALEHIKVWKALKIVIDDPDSPGAPAARNELAIHFSDEEMNKIKTYVP